MKQIYFFYCTDFGVLFAFKCGFSQFNWYLYCIELPNHKSSSQNCQKKALNYTFFWSTNKDTEKYVASIRILLKQLVKNVKPTIFHA